MNLNDILKFMFGLSDGFRHHPRAFTDDDDPMPSCDCYDDSQEGIEDEMPEHFHFHSSESGQMFSHFDDMFRSFDELFRSMGMAQFSAVEPGFPGEHHVAPPQPRGSLRDRMLKEPDTPSGGKDKQIFDFEQGPTWGSSIFGRHWGGPSSIQQIAPPKERIDKDLDGEIKDASQLDDLFGKRAKSPQTLAPMEPSYRRSPPHGTFKSVSVWTRVGADGKVEEHRTVRDNHGNEEDIVTKKIGDQGYSVTKKRDSIGREEVKENYTNMDKRDKDGFERLWSVPSTSPDPLNRQSPWKQLTPSGGDSYDPQTRSMFRNLFGFSFPGFGKA